VTSSNHQAADFEASMRLGWAGSSMIALGVTVFVVGLLAVFIAKLMAAAYLMVVGCGAGALIGLGYRLAMEGMRRQRNMHASVLTGGTTRRPFTRNPPLRLDT